MYKEFSYAPSILPRKYILLYEKVFCFWLNYSKKTYNFKLYFLFKMQVFSSLVRYFNTISNFLHTHIGMLSNNNIYGAINKKLLVCGAPTDSPKSAPTRSFLSLLLPIFFLFGPISFLCANCIQIAICDEIAKVATVFQICRFYCDNHFS